MMRKLEAFVMIAGVTLPLSVSATPPGEVVDKPDKPPPVQTVEGWTLTQVPYNPCFIDGLINGYRTIVTGIWFDKPDHGVVTVRWNDQDDRKCSPIPNGHVTTNKPPPGSGAIMAATGPTTFTFKPIVDGATAVADVTDHLQFWRLIKTPHGLAAAGDAAFAFWSDNNGKSFQHSRIGSAEPTKSHDLWLFEDAKHRWTTFDADYYLRWTDSKKPTKDAKWEENYLMQKYGARSQLITAGPFYQTPDGETIIMPSDALTPSGKVGVWVSHDRGKTFTRVEFKGKGTESGMPGAGAMAFCGEKHGVAANGWLGIPNPSVFYTSDLGKTWSEGKLPDSAADHNAIFETAFFAPDCKHVWIAGYFQKGYKQDGKHGLFRPTFYASSDGGKTFTDMSKHLDDHLEASHTKWLTGFALDADHLWLGGQNGLIIYTANAGRGGK
jgi:hypothetical protein